MKTVALFAASCCLLFASCATTTPAPAGIGEFEGASIVAFDGTFLGIVSKDPRDTKSIADSTGMYGSKISTSSIFDSIGPYGSGVSSMSAFNAMASNPPKLVATDGTWIYLTANPTLAPRIAPETIVKFVGK